MHGVGHVTESGTIVLVQRVEREGEEPTTREWRIHPTGGGHYEGTLSDAVGPVQGDVVGNRLHLSFTMTGGFQAEQWLDLLPSGNVALNHMAVRKFGFPVATLEETITRTQPRIRTTAALSRRARSGREHRRHRSQSQQPPGRSVS